MNNQNKTKFPLVSAKDFVCPHSVCKDKRYGFSVIGNQRTKYHFDSKGNITDKTILNFEPSHYGRCDGCNNMVYIKDIEAISW